VCLGVLAQRAYVRFAAASYRYLNTAGSEALTILEKIKRITERLG
jgi:hypothetical protein